MDLRGEYGLSWLGADEAETARDRAWHLQLRGETGPQIQYLLEQLHAGPEYAGFYEDTDLARASVSAPLGARLRAYGSCATYHSNLDADPAQTTAPRELRYRFHLDYQFPSPTLLSGGYAREERYDALSPRGFDQQAQSAFLSLRRAFDTVSLHATARLLRLENHLTDRTTEHLAGRGEARYRPTRHQQYAAFYAKGHEGLTADPDLEQTVGLSAAYDWPPRLELRLRAEQRGLAQDRLKYFQFTGELRYRLRHGHELRVEARVLDFEDPALEDHLSLRFAYALPFGIPVARRTDRGGLRGRVYDAEDPRGAGLPDVVLYLSGATAVTSARGEFLFPAVPPGAHYLWIDLASLGPHRVPTLRLPCPLQLAGGTERKLDLGITRSASLTLQVTRLQPAPGRSFLLQPGEEPPPLFAAGGLPYLEIELHREDETLVRNTDSQGALTLSHLRPGTWTIQVPEKNLPPHHRPEEPEWSVELKPGTSAQLELRIQPRFRRLILLDE